MLALGLSITSFVWELNKAYTHTRHWPIRAKNLTIFCIYIQYKCKIWKANPRYAKEYAEYAWKYAGIWHKICWNMQENMLEYDRNYAEKYFWICRKICRNMRNMRNMLVTYHSIFSILGILQYAEYAESSQCTIILHIILHIGAYICKIICCNMQNHTLVPKSICKIVHCEDSACYAYISTSRFCWCRQGVRTWLSKATGIISKFGPGSVCLHIDFWFTDFAYYKYHCTYIFHFWIILHFLHFLFCILFIFS